MAPQPSPDASRPSCHLHNLRQPPPRPRTVHPPTPRPPARPSLLGCQQSLAGVRHVKDRKLGMCCSNSGKGEWVVFDGQGRHPAVGGWMVLVPGAVVLFFSDACQAPMLACPVAFPLASGAPCTCPRMVGTWDLLAVPAAHLFNCCSRSSPPLRWCRLPRYKPGQANTPAVACQASMPGSTSHARPIRCTVRTVRMRCHPEVAFCGRPHNLGRAPLLFLF